MNELVFTPAGILELLSQVDELKDYNISVVETLDGQLQLQIGDSTYQLSSPAVPEVEVQPEVVEQVEAINQEAYSELNEDEYEVSDTIEGGLISEFVKAVKLGGMLRLAAKVIPKNLL